MTEDLLPSNATAFERAASLSIDVLPKVNAGVASMRTAKLVSIPDSFLPFLIFEYGLGPVSAYVTDARALIETGIDWQRVRGTPEAVDRALDWIGYAGNLEEARVTRRRWNLFQLALDRLRDAETPDLDQIEALVGLSVPVRSHFFRGFFGYDVREAEWSQRRYSGSRWSSSSGARLRPGGVKWSFGRTTDFDFKLSRDELIAIGVWQPPIDNGTEGFGLRFVNTYVSGETGWGGFSWDATTATWDGYDESDRLALMANAMGQRPLWACLRRADNSVIGYRRARVARPVTLRPGGPYQVGIDRFAPETQADSFYAEFLTDFGNGNGSTATSVSLVFDALPLDTTKPGLQWAEPGQITPGIEIAQRAINIPMGRTVRERLRFHLTF